MRTRDSAIEGSGLIRVRRSGSDAGFVLERRIGFGGMAEVFLARAPNGKKVAIKVLLPRLCESAEHRMMLADEARIGLALDHPNIVRVLDHGELDGRPYLALEYVAGKTLTELQAACSRRGVPLPMLMYVARSICHALHFAHGRRDAAGEPLDIVHRDIALDNVMVGFDGTVKLLDFGIARARDRRTSTQAHHIKGKLGYMAPEQMTGEPIDVRTDVYSLGALLYHLLTGADLQSGENDFASFLRILEGRLVPPTSINASVPQALERVVLKALQVEPADRYQSVGALRRALAAAALRLDVQPLSQSQMASWMNRLRDVGPRQMWPEDSAPTLVAHIDPDGEQDAALLVDDLDDTRPELVVRSSDRSEPTERTERTQEYDIGLTAVGRRGWAGRWRDRIAGIARPKALVREG